MDTKKIFTTKTSEFPEYIEFQINSLCNANCTICPYENVSKKFPQEQMSEKLLDKIINELASHKTQIKRVIPYLNNEPSIDNRMIAVLRKLKESGHFIELSSNMSGITKEKAEILINERLVNELRISFFGGTPDVYKKMMPNLDFNDTVSKIRCLTNLNNANGRPIDIKIILILYPELECDENIRFIEKLFPNIPICTFGFLDRADNLKKSINEKILTTKNNRDFILRGCDLNRPFERICIMSNGKVIFCSQDWNREVELGNISHQTISEVWNGELFESERKRLLGYKNTPENYLCKRCKLVHLENRITGEKRMNFLGDRYLDENDRFVK